MSTGLRAAVTTFTAIPVPGAPARIDRPAAARAVLWLPLVGAVLGGCAGLILIGVPDRLLGAALAIAFLALATRCMHLDGLADTADGLGSRAPAARALEIMRQSDIGPFGVATLVLVLLIQVAALASFGDRAAAGAMILAVVTGRLMIVLAAGPEVPCARPGGFGALVAGSVRLPARLAIGCVVAGGSGTIAVATGDAGAAARTIAALVLGLLAGALLCRTAVRRLGGITGDVFGAIAEIAATATLVTLALSQ